ncbi:TDP-N-acetylfucosamine:lipid II N-acetylfucosaminyltransferase [Stutzerimonas stutzeri]|uniref:TDP-N-acetylfucosamine:lipid II N-acetylfucosaminyltransferase n=1 Tax=Stutzerimonas stutzeri TaxID=316 RepID=UPI0021092FCC|nr:TDP-N-acetylfucosamine:lipid II N-acetylfucosaminyltransferase [Stutzerimonas stutzeri]MCQ4240362.1 TDP-N-acetylfucosamine:lipid II N-acetylfucosaminyltransferase [Stutzerimonas stutzeri]
MKILHIGSCDNIITDFVGLIKGSFNFSGHEFLLDSNMADKDLPLSSNVHLAGRSKIGRLIHLAKCLIKMHQANKIIIHGLTDIRLVQILFFCPWLLKKCYWIIWGGDLYVFRQGEQTKRWRKEEFFRRPVIKNMGNLVSYIKGDVDLARLWYGAKGVYHECIMYTSNLYKEYAVQPKKNNSINILVGNSADAGNNHEEALAKLLPFRDKDISIYVPLSYGDQVYAQQVIGFGKEWFGDKFKPLTEFIPFQKYLELLGSIDIAIFNHKRQQAMGNTIVLVGLGKTVYLRSDVTQWQLFQDMGIVVGDTLRFSSLGRVCSDDNKSKVREYFSKGNLINQLERIFA